MGLNRNEELAPVIDQRSTEGTPISADLVFFVGLNNQNDLLLTMASISDPCATNFAQCSQGSRWRFQVRVGCLSSLPLGEKP